MGFCYFHVEKKWFSSLMRIRSGIFSHCEIDDNLTVVSFAYSKNQETCFFKKKHSSGVQAQIVLGLFEKLKFSNF